MSHKLEITNLVTASRTKDPSIRQLRNKIQDVINLIDRFHQFIDTACHDCADNDDTVIKRSLFESKIQEINDALANAIADISNTGTPYLNLTDYWPVGITDTTGLTNPAPEPEPNPDEVV